MDRVRRERPGPPFITWRPPMSRIVEIERSEYLREFIDLEEVMLLKVEQTAPEPVQVLIYLRGLDQPMLTLTGPLAEQFVDLYRNWVGTNHLRKISLLPPAE
jgi:hypothetical protein